MTTIRYFIPEDGDDEMHPNVFLAPKARQPGVPPTLLAIKDAFPLPGHYHFRFKSPLFPGADREKGAMAVWMDVTQDQQPVPTWKNSIVAKVTRLSMEEDDDDDDDDHHFHTPAASSAPPVQATHSHASSNVSTGSGDHLDMFFDNQSPPPQQQQQHHHHQQHPPQQQGQPNLFDSHPTSAPSTGGSLLDFGASPAPAPAAHSDFLGMTAPPSGGAPQQQQQQQRPPQQQHYQQQQQQQQQQGQSFRSYSQKAQPFGDLGSWS